MLEEKTQQSIIAFVQKEPRTVQELAQHIGKSWVTTEAYCTQISERTGLLALKTFRKGTQGALKLVYYNYTQRALADETRAGLLERIRIGRGKRDLEFLDIYQFVPEEKKKAWIEKESRKSVEDMLKSMRTAERTLHIFSGNLSFVQLGGVTPVRDVIKELLARGVHVRVLSRVNLGTRINSEHLAPLLQAYPRHFEIRHAHQPLRGFLVDDTLVRMKDEESVAAYREGELESAKIVIYEVYDQEWVDWIQQVFWQLWRSSTDYQHRLSELAKLR